MKRAVSSHLVKSEDLNHHETLFAGRMTEWFIENCFICASKQTEKQENIVCKNIHQLSFNLPVKKGDIVNIESYIAKVGRTSFTVYGKATKNNLDEIILDGFITFVFIDSDGKATPHNIVLDKAAHKEEIKVRKKALKLLDLYKKI